MKPIPPQEDNAIWVDVVNVVKSPQQRNPVIGHLSIVKAEIQEQKYHHRFEYPSEPQERNQSERPGFSEIQHGASRGLYKGGGRRKTPLPES